MKRAIQWILIKVLILNLPCWGWSQVVLSDDFQLENITPYIQFLKDSTLIYTIDSVLKYPEQFKQKDKTIANFGFMVDYVWAKVNIQYNGIKPKTFYVEIPFPHINHLQFFLERHKTKILEQSSLMGDYLPFTKRDIKHRNYIYQIFLEPQDRVTLFAFIDRKNETLSLTFDLWSKARFIQKETYDNLFFGGIFSLHFLYILIVLIALFYLKERFLKWYAIFVIIGFMYGLSNTGFGFQLIWGSFGGIINSYLRPTLVGFMGISLLLFSTEFFQIQMYKPLFYKIIYGFSALYIGLIFSTLGVHPWLKDYLEYQQWLIQLGIFQQIFLLLTFLTCIIIPIETYINTKSKESLIFILAYSVYFLITMVIILGVLGFHSIHYDYQKISVSVVVVELTIFTFAVIRRIQYINIERQELAIKVVEYKLKNANAKLDGQHTERRRISRDLHDTVGAQLTSIITRLDILSYQSTKKPSDFMQIQLEKTSNNARNTMQSLRETIWVMRQDSHTLPAYARKIQQFLQRYLEDLPIEWSVNVKGNAAIELSPTQTLHTFRIIQEATQNMVKYAQASDYQIELNAQEKLNIMIKDNGIGMDLKQKQIIGHYGLEHMEERVQDLKGQLDILTKPNQGFEIRIVIPIDYT